MFTLTIQAEGGGQQVLTLSANAVVGRGGKVDLAIPDPSISRRHARFTLRDGLCFVEDLGSANGTRVNGFPADRSVPHSQGDLVELGFVRAVFGAGPASAPDASGGGGEAGREPHVLYALPADQSRAGTQAGDPPQVSLEKHLRFLDGLAGISDMAFDANAVIGFAAEQLLVLMPSAARAFVMLMGADGVLVPGTIRTRTGRGGPIEVSRTILREVVDRRIAVLVADVQDDARFASSDSVHALGIRSAVSAPIQFQGTLLGVLQIDTAAGVAFNKSDVALVLALASQIGLALSMARLHEAELRQRQLDHDMELATRVQQHFLPSQPPSVPGYGFTFVCRPALGVGGDFFEFLDLGEARIGIVVGDVSGKGVSAALYAARLTSDLRYQAAGQSHPAEILSRLNKAVGSRHQAGMFATVTVAVLDCARGYLEVAGAGHPQPIMKDRQGRVSLLGQIGAAPLGVNAAAEFPQQRSAIEPQSTVLFYSDGVTEAVNSEGHIFGDERLLDVFRAASGSADAHRDRVESAVRAFVGGEPQSDDLTIVCVQRS